MANWITLGRVLLLGVLLGILFYAPPRWQLVNPPLLLLIISLDGLDGYVARRRSESSLFGAVADIAADRIVENALWIALAVEGLAPAWAAMICIVRGTIVDQIRQTGIARGQEPFSMLNGRWGERLVAGRLMRGTYGTVKAMTFAWLLALSAWPALPWGSTTALHGLAMGVGYGLVIASVSLCLVRGVPVVIQFVSENFPGRACEPPFAFGTDREPLARTTRRSRLPTAPRTDHAARRVA